MKKFSQIVAVLALGGTAVFGIPNLANAQNQNQGGDQQGQNQQGARGAPLSVVGAGLPILAVGYGVYWLIKRRRKVE